MAQTCPAASRLKHNARRHRMSVPACVWGRTVCSGKRGRGTAHPSTPFTVRRPYVSGNVRIRIVIEDGKLLLDPFSFLYEGFLSAVMSEFVSLSQQGGGQGKIRRQVGDGHRKTNGLVPNVPQPQY